MIINQPTTLCNLDVTTDCRKQNNTDLLFIPNYNELTKQFIDKFLIPKKGKFAHTTRVLSEHSDYIFMEGVLNKLDLTSSVTLPNGAHPYTMWKNNTITLRKQSISEYLNCPCTFNIYNVNYGWNDYEIIPVPFNRSKKVGKAKPQWSILVKKLINKGHNKEQIKKIIHKINDHNNQKHMHSSNFNKLWNRATANTTVGSYKKYKTKKNTK